MFIQKSRNQNNEAKKMEFTVDQVLFLNRQLPKGFMFLPITKGGKQSKMVKGKIKNNRFIDEQLSQSSSISARKQTNKTRIIKNQRVNPVVSIRKQEKIIHINNIKISEEMVAPELKLCWKLLQTLKKHPSSWPFLVPVDPVALGVPTYFEIIKEPMDFKTIETNLCSGMYQTQTQFHADIGKVFMNSYRFNPVGTEYHLITKELQQFYDNIVLNPNFPVPQKSKIILYQPVENSVPKKASNKRAAQVQQFVKSVPKKKVPQSQYLPMSIADKKTLGLNIRRLPRDSLKGVWQIVSDGNITPQELKFDLDKLPINKIRQLQKYVNSELKSNLNMDIVVAKDNTRSTYRQNSDINQQPQSCFVSDDQSI